MNGSPRSCLNLGIPGKALQRLMCPCFQVLEGALAATRSKLEAVENQNAELETQLTTVGLEKDAMVSEKQGEASEHQRQVSTLKARIASLEEQSLQSSSGTQEGSLPLQGESSELGDGAVQDLKAQLADIKVHMS